MLRAGCAGETDRNSMMLNWSFSVFPYLPQRLTKLSMKDLRNAAVILCVCYVMVGRFRRTVSREPEKLLIIPASEPTRFFPRGSPVKDSYTGNTSRLSLATTSNDLTLIFLYAPWCLFSQYARPEFETVAKRFRNQAEFVAVNCAWHAGACARHKRPDHFPVIGAYIGRNQRFFIPYRGVPTAAHLEIFIRRLLHPYRLISVKEDFDEFIHTNDIAVVATVADLIRNSRELQVFWNVSLMTARHDPRNTVAFALLGDQILAKKLGLIHSDAVYLYRTGKVVQVMTYLNRQTDAVIEAAILQAAKTAPLKWIFPTFHKSFALAEVIQNATLIFFTPYQADSRQTSPVINMIHRIAAMYEQCDRASNFTRLLSADRNAKLNRHKAHLVAKDRCRLLEYQYGQLLDLHRRFDNSPQFRCMSLPGRNSTSLTQDICWTQSPFHLTTVPMTYLLPSLECPENRCSNYLSQNRVVSACCYSSVLDHLDDHHRTLSELETCRSVPSDLEAPQSFDIEHLSDTHIAAVQGLKCVTNRSLEFVAIDPIQYPHFLDNLGVSVGSKSSRMVIVDKPASDRYVYAGEITPEAIVNYTKSQLVGHRKSPAPKSGVVSCPTGSSSAKRPKTVTVGELTSNAFNHMLDFENDDVVVLFYTPWCTFCKAVHTTLYNLAAVCRNVTGLSFKRLNIHDNDLPWEHRIVNVPTIQIFPTRRKRDNVATFPPSSILSLLNLLKFTLLNASPSVWHGVVSTRCTAACWQANRLKSRKLLRGLRKEVKSARSALILCDGHCDNTARLKWRVRQNRLKIKFLSAILSAHSAKVFMDLFSADNFSAFNELDKRGFIREFFTEFVLA